MIPNAQAPRATTIFALVVATLLMATPGAVAQHPTDEAGPGERFTHHHRSKQLSKSCVAKYLRRHKPRRARRCQGRLANHAGKARRVAMHDLTRDQLAVVGSNGETLRHAFKHGSSIRYRSFSQLGSTLIGPKQLYGEKHDGGGFFDGENVWLNSPTPGGPSGFHDCFPISEVGYDVTIENCGEHFKDPGGMTPYYQYWMRWNVAFGWGAINPIKFHYNVHVNLHGSGRLTYWIDDTKTGDDPS
jgi:hypothetical protein